MSVLVPVRVEESLDPFTDEGPAASAVQNLPGFRSERVGSQLTFYANVGEYSTVVGMGSTPAEAAERLLVAKAKAESGELD